jgi:hypothetical protein
MNPMLGLPDPAREGFRPPFCPNPDCSCHRDPAGWRPRHDGFFVRVSDHARIRRFRCAACRRRFSSQTFSTTYWLRYRHLPPIIAALVSEGPGLRQSARLLGITCQTVARHVARVGRHSQLFHHRMRCTEPLAEPIVVDGFESFEYSQYFPFHTNLAVGANSWAIYHFTDSPLRRKGAMTPGQKQRRAQLELSLGRPDPRAIERAIVALVRHLLRSAAGPILLLRSDEHPAYRRALETVRRETTIEIRHEVTPARQARTRSNPLFQVNLKDLLLRHHHANHRRETIAFSKRRQASHERVAIFTVYCNCIRRLRAQDTGPVQTAAMRAGWTPGPWTWRRVLGRRLFPSRTDLPEAWMQIYQRRVRTAILGERQTVHACRYAF